MRFALAAGITAFLCLGLAVHAGPLPAVADPFDVSGCGEEDYAANQMGDPNAIYATVQDCTNLCRLAGFECRKLTKQTYSCQTLIVGKRVTWSKANCKAT